MPSLSAGLAKKGRVVLNLGMNVTTAQNISEHAFSFASSLKHITKVLPAFSFLRLSSGHRLLALVRASFGSFL